MHNRPLSALRTDAQETFEWSDEEDALQTLRDAALRRCMVSQKHFEARLRNIADHFRVRAPHPTPPPPDSVLPLAHAGSGVPLGNASSCGPPATAMPRERALSAESLEAQAGVRTSAMRPAPPTHATLSR